MYLKTQGVEVHFTLDRLDNSQSLYEYMYETAGGYRQSVEPKARQVLIEDFANPDEIWTAVSEVSPHYEVLQRVKFETELKTSYLTFVTAENAQRFVDAYNSATFRTFLGGGKAVLGPPLPLTKVDFRIARAVLLGATRMLCIYGIVNWRWIKPPIIKKDFVRFGHILRVDVQVGKFVFIEYDDIFSALKAVNYLSVSSEGFERHAGARVTFAKKRITD
ncbi:hypothetical protein L218DRAFT_961697 [Marasmius fiardii PR-910]|nr:hypothetical protein L218DRAFT_961697 [Marasmius fiardii PR-910]